MRKEVDRANNPQLKLFHFVIRYLQCHFAGSEEMPGGFHLSTSNTMVGQNGPV